jgi:F-type H+-transporting ATPase subunit b
MDCPRRLKLLFLLAALLGWVAAAPLAAEDPHAAEGHAAPHGGHGEGENHAGGESLPGLNPVEGPHGGFKADLALWSAITFVIFFWLLARFAWGPLRDGLDAREARIRQDIAEAEAHRVKAEQLLREYETKLAKVQEEVKEILAEARRDAETARQDIIATAEKESAAMRQRAVADIERARDQALNELFAFVSQNVMQATEKILGRSLNGGDHERLVREALANLELRKN